MILEAREVTVRFGGVEAVAGLSLGVGAEEIVGLVGPNGSGKSSFLNALSGVVRAGGEASIDGRPLPMGRPRRIRMQGLLRTYQTPQTYLALTCLENVLVAIPDRTGTGLGGAWVARPRMWRAERERWKQAAAALDRVGLLEHAERPAALLTYGQQRLLDVARMLAARPRVVMFDEPAAGLNAAESERLAELLLSMREDGVALLVVDHKIDFIDRLCDRIVVLQLGRKVAEGPPAQVWRDPKVVDAYLGEADARG